MSEFWLYLRLGFEHIADVNAYDHLLFVVVLSSGYSWGHLRQLVILVTAFTVGHSITLALSALDVVHLSQPLVETLIPATILATAVYNATRRQHDRTERQLLFNYVMALLFGLIHGMGFSAYFRSILGREASIVFPLFSFNIGIEIGQLTIVLAFLAVMYVMLEKIRLRLSDWMLFINGVGGGLALLMLVERLSEAAG